MHSYFLYFSFSSTHVLHLLSHLKTLITVPISIIHQLTSYVCFFALINERKGNSEMTNFSYRMERDCVISHCYTSLARNCESIMFLVWPMRFFIVSLRLFA